MQARDAKVKALEKAKKERAAAKKRSAQEVKQQQEAKKRALEDAQKERAAAKRKAEASAVTITVDATVQHAR